jgi:hypothetical protein
MIAVSKIECRTLMRYAEEIGFSASYISHSSDWNNAEWVDMVDAFKGKGISVNSCFFKGDYHQLGLVHKWMKEHPSAVERIEREILLEDI